MKKGELILCQTEDGLSEVNLRASDGTVWLTQLEISELFDTSKQNVSFHLQNIFADRELLENSVVKYSLTTAIEQLNRIVTMYLDYAEDQAKQRSTMTMAHWSDKLDSFLKFNERDLLMHPGKVKMLVAKKLAEDRYRQFDDNRKKHVAIEADEDDIHELEAFIEQIDRSED